MLLNFSHRCSYGLKILSIWLSLLLQGCILGMKIQWHIDHTSVFRDAVSGAIFALATLDMMKLAITLLLAEAVALEGNKLDFETVGKATCSHAGDGERILHAIHGYENDIDDAIRVLKAVGRYDDALHANIARGMHIGLARAGVRFAPAMFVCCSLTCVASIIIWGKTHC